MNPDDAKLAEQECQELLKFGLIEISHSQWACQAFYVNKRSEQVRGKRRLVINYQPLNIFLLDDKFPIPNRFTLFTQISKAKWFSKFDLKSGFWQLGIHPEDRHKTGFWKCTPEQHVGHSVKDFPEENLSKTQVQQFVGVVNYVREFIPKASPERGPLTKMLRKKPPLWGPSQTQAIQILKKELQNLPTLHIPSNGKKILQTDANDKYWGAVLLEEDEQGTKHCCGFASGKFKVSEQHFYTSFAMEILAVKNGIKKFSFFLISHHFLVEMDMGSFPKMLNFKQNLVPNPQLLRWSAWFSQYSFDVKNIKGKKNIVADFFSRKKPLPQQALSTQVLSCLMFSPVSSEPPDIHQLIHGKKKILKESVINRN
ncbi:unnamed protein product [Coffea canephora]|uniref:DH200=94 genomic scaffold, scaffold_353 n=1 Tax=Coffea canephora TaxID=49390 RepID=A0A068VHG7_COFCA|nr:unnamed protein product [Coffea canephora]